MCLCTLFLCFCNGLPASVWGTTVCIGFLVGQEHRLRGPRGGGVSLRWPHSALPLGRRVSGRAGESREAVVCEEKRHLVSWPELASDFLCRRTFPCRIEGSLRSKWQIYFLFALLFGPVSGTRRLPVLRN